MASGAVNPFIWINTIASNNDGALQNLKVRQALQYAVDKAAVVQTLGGPDVAACRTASSDRACSASTTSTCTRARLQG